MTDETPAPEEKKREREPLPDLNPDVPMYLVMRQSTYNRFFEAFETRDAAEERAAELASKNTIALVFGPQVAVARPPEKPAANIMAPSFA